jgi:hypothetical protein
MVELVKPVWSLRRAALGWFRAAVQLALGLWVFLLRLEFLLIFFDLQPWNRAQESNTQPSYATKPDEETVKCAAVHIFSKKCTCKEKKKKGRGFALAPPIRKGQGSSDSLCLATVTPQHIKGCVNLLLGAPLCPIYRVEEVGCVRQWRAAKELSKLFQH